MTQQERAIVTSIRNWIKYKFDSIPEHTRPTDLHTELESLILETLIDDVSDRLPAKYEAASAMGVSRNRVIRWEEKHCK